MEVTHTKLFVPVEDSTLLLGTVSHSLQKICHVRAVIGPTRCEDKSCEVLLLPLSKVNAANYDRAKEILRNYLNLMVKNNQIIGKQVTRQLEINQECKQLSSNNKRRHRRTKHLICGNNNNRNQNNQTINLDDSSETSTETSSIAPHSLPLMKDIKRRSPLTIVLSPSISDTDDIEIVDLANDCDNTIMQPVLSLNDIFKNDLPVGESGSVKTDVPIAKTVSVKKDFTVGKTGSVKNDLCLSKSCDLMKQNIHNPNNKFASWDVPVIEDDDDDDVIFFSAIDKKTNKCLENTSSINYNSKIFDKNLNNTKRQNGNISKHSAYNQTSLSTSTILVEKNDNGIINCVDNLICNSSKSSNSCSEVQEKEADATAIDIVSNSDKLDEIILISENDDDSEIDDNLMMVDENKCDEDNDIDVIEEISCKKLHKNSKSKKKRQRKRLLKQILGQQSPHSNVIRNLRQFTKDELIENGFLIDFPLNKQKTSPKQIDLSKERKCFPSDSNLKLDDKSSTITASSSVSSSKANILWTRPPHFNSQSSHISEKNISSNSDAVIITGVPTIKNFSTTTTLVKKRRHSSSNDHINIDKRVGSNVYVPNDEKCSIKTGLRPIVIDASNVAFSHGLNKEFSTKGIEICIKYFLSRGHKVIAMLPNYRKSCLNSRVHDTWERDGTLVFTPSRKVDGRLVVSHDDRYIIQCAAALDGIIVSKDNYRDFIGQNKLWDDTIQQRLLMFTWVGDLLMFPEDPLGRNGPSLDNFLKFPSKSSSTSVSSSKRK